MMSYAFAGAMTAAAAAQAQSSPTPAIDYSRAETFLNQLQRAVDSRDRPGVARLFKYPSTVLASGFNIPVANTQELLRMYDLVFNSEMRCAIVQSGIARAGAPRPKYPVSVTSEGFAIGAGLVWAQKSGTQFRVARVTVPPSFSFQRSQEPRRVRFPDSQKNERSAQFSNWLARDEADSYLVAARKGQFLQVRIEGFRGADATLRLYYQTTGRALGVPGRDVIRAWAGAVAETTTYRIDVARLAPYCDPALLYRLAITLR